MKKQSGLSRISIVIIVAVLVLLICLIVGIVIGNKQKQKQIEDQQKANMEAYEQQQKKENIVENKIEEKPTKKVEPLNFTKEFLESGNSKGNVEFIENRIDNSFILSITGVADNGINEVNFVSTKNRWYKTVDLTDYSTIEFYARNGEANGDIMICVDNTIIHRVRYTDVPNTWTKYTVDISKYEGEHTLAIAGGYADNTGSQDSNTQYRNIRLK